MTFYFYALVRVYKNSGSKSFTLRIRKAKISEPILHSILGLIGLAMGFFLSFIFYMICNICYAFNDDTFGILNFINTVFFVDIDECSANPNVCQYGSCDNTLGSFTCKCEEGYSVKIGEGPGCTDDDECLLGTYDCDVNADCINTDVSFFLD